MRKTVRLTESDLNRIVNRIVSEAPTTNYEDTPEGLRQYIKDTENRTVYLSSIKKEGDVYVVNFSKKYKYQNGRFTMVSTSSFNPERQQKRNNVQTILTSVERLRGIQDRNVLNSIRDFYYEIIDSKNIGQSWDDKRRKYKIELYIPSWQEYQLMQNLA